VATFRHLRTSFLHNFRTFTTVASVSSTLPVPVASTVRSIARRAGFPLVLAVVLAAACSGPARTIHPAAQTEDSVVVGSADIVAAEHAVRDYFSLLAEGRAADARALLASGPRSEVSAAEMDRVAAALRQVQVRTLLPLHTTHEQIVFQATLDVAPDPAEPGEWQAGANTRWIEVSHSRRGWRIARIASTPIAGAEHPPVRQWALVHILDAGVSMEVPHAWQRQPQRWAWSPSGRSVPVVEVRWDEGVPEAGPDAHARVVRTLPVELAWGRGTEYSVEVPAATGGAPAEPLHRIHFVVRHGEAGRTISLLGEAHRREDLRTLRLVLRRMLTSMQFAAPSSLTAEAPGG
jgi:hypothetical protein